MRTAVFSPSFSITSNMFLTDDSNDIERQILPYYPGPIKAISPYFIAFAGSTLLITTWQALVYLWGLGKKGGYKVARTIVLILCLAQVIHTVAACVASIYYIRHPGISFEDDLHVHWTFKLMFLATLLSVFLVQITIVLAAFIVSETSKLVQAMASISLSILTEVTFNS
ncbi:hypothetical protein C8Q75DRAFT_751003 [Abortiporus biennis]|nr:hypothetical protein C8Q75DRAFT_751003 [Abortiporus biennis]